MELKNHFASFIYFSEHEWEQLSELAKEHNYPTLHSYLQSILDFNPFSVCSVEEVLEHRRRLTVINEWPNRIAQYLTHIIDNHSVPNGNALIVPREYIITLREE